MKTVVIYHGRGCKDGFCAAWLFSHAFPHAEFHPAEHGHPPVPAEGADVFLLDFCYKRPDLEALAKNNRSVAVIDHHATATPEFTGLSELNENFRVHFDLNFSGGRLAWAYLVSRGLLPRPFDERPWLVDYTMDRDLWTWELPQSREVNSAIRSYPMDFGVWDNLAARDPQSLVPEGAAILRMEEGVVRAHVARAWEVRLAGHTVRCVNASLYESEVAGELARDRPFGVCYHDRADGFRVFSLRARGSGIDVSAIAKRYGGGGHPNAAGFQVMPGFQVEPDDFTRVS